MLNADVDSLPLRHYLLTRFNLPLWNKDKHGLATRDEAWLENRCRLFEQYTLPSVQQQSCKDFVWVVRRPWVPVSVLTAVFVWNEYKSCIRIVLN